MADTAPHYDEDDRFADSYFDDNELDFPDEDPDFLIMAGIDPYSNDPLAGDR